MGGDKLMSQLQAILNYQEIDTKLYKLEREIAGCDERKEYVKFKKFLETAPEKLDSLETKASGLKSDAAELEKMYARMEETLKDFEHVDELINGGADIAFYKKKVQSVMEQLKKLKAELATLSASIKETDAEFQKLKKQVISAQKQYADASEKYKAVKTAKEPEKKELETQLLALEKEIPEKMLSVYKTKRKEKIFPVVGELTSGRCPFCSMEPPLAARSKLTGGGAIECDNCHRIIFSK
jgi:predicted  nucleic acid-binding Zn-ribbon protein